MIYRGNKVKYVLNAFLVLFISSCTAPQNEMLEADLLVKAKRIYICDSTFAMVEAMAISEGEIIAYGSAKELETSVRAKEVMEYDGYIYPGFIDAHSHFYGYARSLIRVDLKNTHSLDDMLERVLEYSKNSEDEWIIGRGWDNTDWVEQGFPNNIKLNLLFPDRPVVLRRVDGHAALVNQKALDLAGINASTIIDGGEIEKRNGVMTGILIDNAVDKVIELIAEPARSSQIMALKQAQKNCFKEGLTTVCDAGLALSETLLIDSLQRIDNLRIKTYIMSNPGKEEIAYWIEKGPYRTDRMEMRSFKLYADGSLGSRGALLKEDYCDKPGHRGFYLNSPDKLDSLCRLLYTHNFQVATHCIGDSANRKMLEIYGAVIGENNTQRWRIEHAQVVSPEDRELFLKYRVIPSVQPTHATSDMNWAEDRLCEHRMAGAYAFKSLKEILGFIPLGTDFPVEHISPLRTFYAAVYRKDLNEMPGQGFLPSEALSPKEALMGMTLWAAYACFMEDKIGSLEQGKSADFVCFREDVLYHNRPFDLQVDETWSEGERVYKAN